MPSRGAWLGKPCDRCKGRKGRQYAASKFCGNCKPKAAKASAEAAWATRLKRAYGITAEQYWKLYEFQGGACYLCQRATGKTKRLAVDHDHACCPELPACGRCVRGLLCGTCNKIIGHARDDTAFFARGMTYLVDPPWQAMNRPPPLPVGSVHTYDLVLPPPFDWSKAWTPLRNDLREAA